MVGVAGALIILEVTRGAPGVQGRVLAIRMAKLAVDDRVRAGQGELGGIVIELRAEPLRSVVAQLAVLREAGREVIGIIGALVILEVARHTIRAER